MERQTLTLKLRGRGQLTIPKDWLEVMGAQEGDVFVAVYEPHRHGRIILDFQPARVVNFTDALEKYMIADLKTQGYSLIEIEKMLPAHRVKLEEAYAQYLRELEASGDFVDGEDWLKKR